MMNLGPHAGFIVAAYAAAAVVMVALAVWVALDHRNQKRRLASFEAQGVIRRSDRAVEKTA
jgi:heme exporter protein D